MSAMQKHDTKDAEKISALAYEMWEKAGRPDTDPDKFWYEAEQELAVDKPVSGIGDEASAEGFARDMSGPETDETVEDDVEETKAKKARSKKAS